MSAISRSAACLAAILLGACASTAGDGEPAAEFRATRMLTHEDGQTDGQVAFPDGSYESLMRFSTPVAGVELRRVWWRQAGAGRVLLSVYDNSALDGPGEVIYEIEREVTPSNVSDGQDARWLFEDLPGVSVKSDTVWVGMRERGGEVSLWASQRDAGRYFVRTHRSGGASGLLPVRRTPLVRLETAP